MLRSEGFTAARLLARGMADNPNHVRVFEMSPAERAQVLERMFSAVIRQQLDHGVVLGAFHAHELVGVLGMLPPGRCPSASTGTLAAFSALVLGSGLKSARRVLAWLDDWTRSDPQLSHWHLGPLAVEPRLQGQGIGKALLGECCRRMDERQCAAYLENDRPENVALFESFGFHVREAHDVLGTRNWFMLRPAPP
jgi:ribosomal protein S18 acetylase RimI-like enzyme